MSKRDKCIDGVELLKKEQKNKPQRGPTGPCCNVPIVPTHFSINKPLAATFYGIGNGEVGVGDVFDFPLDGPNDPIERLGPGDPNTFVLPFAGFYKVQWQIPINEPSAAQFALGGHVQSTLTAQTVDEGAFVPVAGGVVGKGVPVSQIVGETIVVATRNNYPIRIENTSNIPVSYYAGIPEHPNQRTINISSIVPQRLDAVGVLANNVPETVAPNADVTFSDRSGTTGPDPDGGIGGTLGANVGFTPASPPYTGFVIQKSGLYVVRWRVVYAATITNPAAFYPYLNGVRLNNIGPTGASGSSNIEGGQTTPSTVLNIGDVITLRNESGTSIALSSSEFPNAYMEIYSYGT